MQVTIPAHAKANADLPRTRHTPRRLTNRNAPVTAVVLPDETHETGFLDDPSLALGRRDMSGPDFRPEYRFEILQRRGWGLARESGEVVNHVDLIVVAEAMGDFGP